MKALLLYSLVLLLGIQCNPSSGDEIDFSDHPPKTSPNMSGLNFVAPPEPFSNDPMTEVKAVSAAWIAVIPYAYTRSGEASVRYNSEWQWWGERPEGVAKTIKLAKAAGIKVVLKPQVYVPGSWTGDLDYDSKQEWENWERDYEAYIMPFVAMADSMEVPVFCIGTEFKIGARKREAFWRKLIKKVRARYSGKLIYAANWDEYLDVPFWDALDMVGINAYFPLIQKATPSVQELQQAWKPHRAAIRQFYVKTKKPIVFTEYGYLSVDGCAYNTWELEAKVKKLKINEQAQSNALEALLSTFWDEPYWHGGFIWKWFPNMRGGEGYNVRDYTPQGKQGYETLQRWYGKSF